MNLEVSGAQFGDLPLEIRSIIFSHLSFRDAIIASLACRQWRTDILDCLGHCELPKTDDVKSLSNAYKVRKVASINGATMGDPEGLDTVRNKLFARMAEMERYNAKLEESTRYLQALMRAPY